MTMMSKLSATSLSVGPSSWVRNSIDSHRSYNSVESVRRALLILRVLNGRGITSVDQLHRDTKLPKPTIVRLLETLIVEGFVAKGGNQSGYFVTAMVQSLSCGYHGDPLVVQAARSVATDVTRRLQWPVLVGTLDRTEIVIRFSTENESPMAPAHAVVNMRLNLTDRAMGLVYLASCSGHERRALLHMIATTAPGHIVAAGGRKALASRLLDIRAQGFAIRDQRSEPRISNTLAVPVLDEGRVLATIGLAYFRSAVARATLVKQYVPILKHAAQEIAAQVRTSRSNALPDSAP